MDDQMMDDRFTPRNYHEHQDEPTAERERLEYKLGIPFESSDRLDAMNGIDTIIRTGDRR